ncbi:CDP-glycerol glycerophosphotransferase family protein [Spirochaeta dissipatitropha]
MKKKVKKLKKKVKKYKKKLRRVFNFFRFQFSKLYKRQENLVIFSAGKGRLFADNPSYLFKRALKDADLEVYWVTKSKALYAQLKEQGYPCAYAFSSEGKKLAKKAKVAVCSYGAYSDFRGYYLGGANVISTWHGVGLKKVNFAHSKSLNYKRYNHKKKHLRAIHRAMFKLAKFKRYQLISTSPAVSSYYPETFNIKESDVIELGQARNDVFFNTDLIESDKVPAFLASDSRIITYMPTHRKDGKVSQDIDIILELEALNRFCERTDSYFVIKTHFYSKKFSLSEFDRIVNFASSGIDPQVLLYYTDILITDYSSCYTDFLLLDRPVVFYAYDIDEYLTEDREMYFDFFDVTPGRKVSTNAELIDELNVLISGQDEYVQERARVLDIFYSRENQKPVIDKQWKYIRENLLEAPCSVPQEVLHNGKK